MFKIKNIRTGKLENLSSEEFKEKIICETKSQYLSGQVLAERTNIRVEALDILLNELKHLPIQKNIYLVTAIGRINRDKFTRYMILIDGDEYGPGLPDLIFDYVPIYSVEIKDRIKKEGTASPLSHWFRNTMGGGFSFSDIDYLITNPGLDPVLLIEEKFGKSGISSMGYGQLISYKELLTEVIERPNLLLVIFSIEDANLQSQVEYYTCNKNSFLGNNLKNGISKYSTLGVLRDNILKYIE